MNCAVLQKDLTIPPVETLKRAFRNVKFLTAIDAYTLAKDAYGILVKGLSPERANALQSALAAEGIETDVVEERLLPILPQTKFIKRADCLPEGLLVYDPLNRSFVVEWKHLMLVAAGCVHRTDFIRTRTTRRVPSIGDSRSQRPFEGEVETMHKEEQNDHLSLELILSGGVQRFSATAEEFNYAHLGNRRSGSLAKDFATLVKDLLKFAPHAAINRGAYYLREEAPEPFPYPSQNAFFEEIIWLLWRQEEATNK